MFLRYRSNSRFNLNFVLWGNNHFFFNGARASTIIASSNIALANSRLVAYVTFAHMLESISFVSSCLLTFLNFSTKKSLFSLLENFFLSFPKFGRTRNSSAQERTLHGMTTRGTRAKWGKKGGEGIVRAHVETRIYSL